MIDPASPFKNPESPIRPNLTWLSLLDTLSLPATVGVEIGASRGLPQFHMVGLPSRSVSESKERIRAALHASELELPRMRLVVNLTPAGIPKTGTGLELAMALAIVTHKRKSKDPNSICFAWGELTLKGEVLPAGSIARAYFAAIQASARTFIFSVKEQDELNRAIQRFSVLSPELQSRFPVLIPVSKLSEAVDFENRMGSKNHSRPARSSAAPLSQTLEASQVPPSTEGLGRLPRAFEDWVGIAASGSLSVLLLGPPGTGKSHTLDWLTRLVPPPDPSTQLHQLLLRERARIVSSEARDWSRRVGPMIKPAALFGSFRNERYLPGELALAHGSALIADEFPEWSRDSRESLRGPLEKGSYTLARAGGNETLPCRFQFLATGNLCPCGAWGARPPLRSEPMEQRSAFCRCTPEIRTKYRNRLSGPVLDRLDLIIKFDDSASNAQTESQESQFQRLYFRVLQARARLIERFGTQPNDWGPKQFQKAESRYGSELERAIRDPQESVWRFQRRALKLMAATEAWRTPGPIAPEAAASMPPNAAPATAANQSIKFTTVERLQLKSLLSRSWLFDDLGCGQPIHRSPVPLVGFHAMR